MDPKLIGAFGVLSMCCICSSIVSGAVMGGETVEETKPVETTSPEIDNEFELVDGQTVQCASNGPKPQAHAAYRYVGLNKLRWYGNGDEIESWDAGPAKVIDDCTGLSRGSPFQMGMKP